MSAAGVKVDIAMKLPQLQNLIKRDPQAYRDEFLLQHRHYQSEFKIFQLQPSRQSESFGTIITFLSHVASCYPEETKSFPAELMLLLERYHQLIAPKLRYTMAQALILLRNRNAIDSLELDKLFFMLFRCEDKKLRELLFSHIVHDVRNMNKNHRNEKLNKKLQVMIFSLLNDEHEIVAKKAVDVMVELYRRKVWTDSNAVNVLAEACLSKNSKVMVTGVQFFLGIDEKMSEEDDAKNQDVEESVDFHSHAKKTRSNYHRTLKQLRKNKKIRSKKNGESLAIMFPALLLINDPQTFAEKLFKKLRASTEKFETKLMLMNLVGRLIGCHKLILLNFYPNAQRYLTSHQQNVTQILAYLVQACHELVPPEDIQPVVLCIANNFITERNREEVIALGINSIREIISRIPLVLEQESMDYVISDLVQHSKSRDKGIMMAAKGVLNLIREIHPAILRPKERGKYHDIRARPKAYGQLDAKETIEGTELLQEAEEKGLFDGDNDDEWEVASSSENESDNENGWIDVSSDSENVGEEDDIDEVVTSGDEGNSEDEEDDESVVSGEDDNSGEGQETGDVASQEVPTAKGGKPARLTHKERRKLKLMADEERNASVSLVDSKSTISNEITAAMQKERLEAKRILTPKDFERLKMLKEKAAEAAKDPRNRSKKRRREEENTEASEQTAYEVDPNDLEGLKKKKRLTLEERLMTIMAGREKWSSKQKGGGTTNKEKQRKKNFLMVRKGSHAVSDKLKRSAKDLQREKNKKVKSILKHEKKKRRRV